MGKEKPRNRDKVDKMLYKQYISTYVREYEVSPQEATRIIESVFELLKHSIITEGSVAIRGIGSFTCNRGRKGKFKNYETGLIEEKFLRRQIKFLPSLSFKNSLNQSVKFENERYVKKQTLIKKRLIIQGMIQKRSK